MPETTLSTVPVRIDALRAELDSRGLDAFIVPRFDAHQGEYVAPRDERLAWVTGFTGSAGLAIVTADVVAVFVDGRYTVQLSKQCPSPPFEHHHLFDAPPEDWIAERMSAGSVIGFDPMHLPPTWYRRFKDAADRTGAELIPVEANPVDAVWVDQPAAPSGEISTFPLQFAGKKSADKQTDLLNAMNSVGADFAVETQPDNIAWLLNVRGRDVEFNPIPHSFVLMASDGATVWFVDQAKFADDVPDALPKDIVVQPQETFLPTLRQRFGKDDKVLLDPEFSPSAVLLAVEAAGAVAIERPSALTLAKAVKNETELNGLRACHIRDGVAWTEFSAWLATAVPTRAAAGDPLTEQEAEDKILELRQGQPGFIYESFKTISAAAGNAAMCHYATSATSNALILPENPYLIDSGGQYVTGTTDATRSMSFGQTPPGYDEAYTAVYKAFHALATLRFPKGTQGHHIDAISRRPLWDLGLDYDHGTGHGIGHCLSVHEQPQRIGKIYNPVDLKPGMMMSIEPGYYEADRFGIRIENLFEIIEAADGFMEFRNLTYAPIQTATLLNARLTQAEKDWLNQYHADLERELGPHLSDGAQTWLGSAIERL
ncbi:MAG: aminopeptidase P family protein [Pseudomonadota bacterium]